jgi:hypothetical protein
MVDDGPMSEVQLSRPGALLAAVPAGERVR